MLYEWDEDKRLKNIEKHGLDFLDADLVFESSEKVTVDVTRAAGKEKRYADFAEIKQRVLNWFILFGERKPVLFHSGLPAKAKGNLMKKKKMVRLSSEDMKKARRTGASATDWSKVLSLKEEDIDFSDSPEIPPDVFAHSIIQQKLKSSRPRKFQLTLRVDEDVLKWFKARGQGYQTRINSLLRAYKEAHR